MGKQFAVKFNMESPWVICHQVKASKYEACLNYLKPDCLVWSEVGTTAFICAVDHEYVFVELPS